MTFTMTQCDTCLSLYLWAVIATLESISCYTEAVFSVYRYRRNENVRLTLLESLKTISDLGSTEQIHKSVWLGHFLTKIKT